MPSSVILRRFADHAAGHLRSTNSVRFFADASVQLFALATTPPPRSTRPWTACASVLRQGGDLTHAVSVRPRPGGLLSMPPPRPTSGSLPPGAPLCGGSSAGQLRVLRHRGGGRPGLLGQRGDGEVAPGGFLEHRGSLLARAAWTRRGARRSCGVVVLVEAHVGEELPGAVVLEGRVGEGVGRLGAWGASRRIRNPRSRCRRRPTACRPPRPQRVLDRLDGMRGAAGRACSPGTARRPPGSRRRPPARSPSPSRCGECPVIKRTSSSCDQHR